MKGKSSSQETESETRQPAPGSYRERQQCQPSEGKLSGDSGPADPGRRAVLRAGAYVAVQSIVFGWHGDALAKDQTSLLSGEP